MDRVIVRPLTTVAHEMQALQGLARLHSEIEGELRPEQPSPTAEEVLARWQNPMKYRAAHFWVAQTHRGEVVGSSLMRFKRVLENPTAARINVVVGKTWRRQQIGSVLLLPVIRAGRVYGRRDFTFTAKEAVNTVGFLENLHAEKRARTIESHLDLTKALPRKLETMIESFSHLSSKYELMWWENCCPRDLLAALASAKSWMNAAPRGFRRPETWAISADWIREEEGRRIRSGRSWWTLAALDRKTRAIVGFTEVHFSSFRPSIAMHEDTAVNPANRREGFASWLKASIVLKIQMDLPEKLLLTTTNGADNEPILRINRRLGFVPTYKFGKWEVGLAQLKQSLKSLVDDKRNGTLNDRFVFESSAMGGDSNVQVPI